MAKMNKYFYIGLPKTGSTFLEKFILENYKDLDIVFNDAISCYPKLKINYREMLYKIKLNYDNPHIIFITRNENELKWSLYKQFVCEGYYKSFDTWLNEFDFYNIEEASLFIKNNFYYSFIDSYENFKKNPTIFLKRLCNFLNVRLKNISNEIINKSLNDNMVNMVRFMNIPFRNSKNNKGILPMWRKISHIDIIKKIQQ